MHHLNLYVASILATGISLAGCAAQTDEDEVSAAGSAELSTTDKWDNKVRPPQLVNPRSIVISAKSKTSFLSDFDRVGCEGQSINISIPDNEDAVVTMDHSAGPLKFPLWITGGRNVHLKGLNFKPVVQPGCAIGEAHQVRDSKPNIHPRLPGGKVLRLQQVGTTFVEGVDIDAKGMETDCFAIRNRPLTSSPTEAKAKRHVSIINTRCTGIEGLDKTSIGDGIHGDFIQNQAENLGNLNLENVTFLTSSNGITIHKWNGVSLSNFNLRNYSHAWDLRYTSDDKFDKITGLIFTASSDAYRFENVWTNDGRGLNYGILNGQRMGAKTSGNIIKVPEIFAGNPPAEFAPENRVGSFYRSPFDKPKSN